MQRTTLSLDGTWELRHFDGYGTLGGDVNTVVPDVTPPIAATVPGSVYADLVRAGWLADPRCASHSLSAQWVEQQLWFYRRRFDAPAEASGARVWLVFDRLDLDAVVRLNGEVIGTHHNAFRPCRIDVTGKLEPANNELIVRIDSGLVSAADKPTGTYHLEQSALLSKRPWLRKPQFACRWDWAPRLMNVGIAGSVRLEWCAVARIDEVSITQELAADRSTAKLAVFATFENVTSRRRHLQLRVRIDGLQEQHADTRASPGGISGLTCVVPIDSPRLWWPRSQGMPQLYEVEISLWEGGDCLDRVRRTTGIRSVALDQSRCPQGGQYFRLLINGEPIFCKGANWVPADVLWPCVTADEYRQLIELAAEADFNMLRVWGGGLYERHAFYDACDRLGILVWQDFPFACSKYPADNDAFFREVELEATHNVRALSHHPSLVMWCGNNENELGVRDGWIAALKPADVPCRTLFFELLPRIVERNDGSRPYWPSSPWSPGGSHPNDPTVGDQHPWFVGLGPAKGDFWAYRADESRFPNEGGVLGPSTLKTLREMLPESERHVGSRTWHHHDNTQNSWRGERMTDHLLRTHLIDDPGRLSFDDYVRYAGILQGEALETAIDNWRRRKFTTAAAVFWMFNDTWPASTSWTPIDYFRRRKPAFWYVKRAFANLRPICVEMEGDVAFFVVNDFLEPRQITLRYGLFGLTGGRPVDETIDVTIAPNAGSVVSRIPLKHWNKLGVERHGAFAVLNEGGRTIGTHRLFRARFKELAWVRPEVSISQTPTGTELSAESFAWSICLDEDGERPLEDNYFDLLPGIPRVVALSPPGLVASPTAANLAYV